MKPSATLTIVGIVLTAVGAMFTFFGTIEISQSYRGSEGGIVAVVFGLALHVAGMVMVLMGIYRALAKIDALPLPLNAVKDHKQESGSRDNHAEELGESSASPSPASL